VTGASMVAGGGDLDVGMDGSFVRDKPHHEHDAGSVETEALQRGDQTEPIVNTNDSDEAHLSIAESSEQTLAPMTVSPSSVPNAGENGLAIIGISKLTTAKILDKRSSPFRVEYRCKLEPLWLAADLVERAQMGRVHIRSYENGLVRAGRLKTLRVGKPKFSQMPRPAARSRSCTKEPTRRAKKRKVSTSGHARFSPCHLVTNSIVSTKAFPKRDRRLR